MTQKIKELNTLRNICLALFSCVVVFSLAYLFLMNKTVFNTVERQRGEKEVAELSARVAEFEQRYLSLKNNITIATAYERGFKEVSTISYVARGVGDMALAMRNEN